MKKLLFTICLLTGLHAANAQLFVSPHISPAIPTGNFNSISSTGFGFGLEATYAINDHVRIGANIDRYSFNLDVRPFNIDLGSLGSIFKGIGDINFNLTPITATAQYIFPGNVVLPYVGVEAGAYIVSASIGVAGIAGIDVNKTYFGLAPTLGLIYPVSDRLDIYANAKYQTLFINEGLNVDIPFTNERIGLPDHVSFIPITIGVSFKFSN